MDDDKGVDSGSAYVFHWRGETWTYQAKLLLEQDGSELDSFGCSVAYGDSIVVGAIAIGDDHNDNGDASGNSAAESMAANGVEAGLDLGSCGLPCPSKQRAADPWNAMFRV